MGKEKIRRPLLAPPTTKTFRIPFSDLRVFDAGQTSPPATPANDDLGLAAAPGSPLVSTAANNTVIGQKVGFDLQVPDNYVAGRALTLRARAKLGGAIQVTKTIDMLAKKFGDGALGSDIVSQAARVLAIDDAYANYDFALTPTTVAPGDRLHVTCAIDLDDTGGTANKFASIAAFELVYEGT